MGLVSFCVAAGIVSAVIGILGWSLIEGVTEFGSDAVDLLIFQLKQQAISMQRLFLSDLFSRKPTPPLAGQL